MILAIIGINGKMGNRVYEYYKDKYEIVGVDKIKHKIVPTFSSLKEIESYDVVIDFSSPSSITDLDYAIEANKIVLSGTTGIDDSLIQELLLKSKGRFYWSCNYAKGIPIFLDIIKKIRPNYDDFDFVEIHASTKKDSPSGTAKMLAKELNIDISKIQSLRLKLAPAIHEIIFTSKNERVILRHEIINYEAFLEGLNIKLMEMIDNVKETI